MPTDEPCEICGEVNDNILEPRFLYVACKEHVHLTPLAFDRLRRKWYDK